MKATARLKILALVALTGIALLASARAADPDDTINAEIKAVVAKIEAKAQADKRTENDLQENLKELDALAAKYRKDIPEAAATMFLIKAQVYGQIIENEQRTDETLKQIQRDFPDTKVAKQVGQMLAEMKARAEGIRLAKTLVPGAPFPDFKEVDLAGKPISLADYKGKVVLLDFWAIWCPQCRADLPYVIETYEKFHAKGFEIIGVSLDEEKPKLASFIKGKGMKWRQIWDGGKWSSKLVIKYGVESIPQTYLIDRTGKIIAANVPGEELAKAVAKALAAK